MVNELKRVALYIRVSSDRQAKTGDSLREQEDTLTHYVNSKNDMIVHSIYIDDGISGQKLNRDEFSRLMDDVKNGQIDLIIFTKLDRWFRSLRHYLNIQATLDKYNVPWIAVSQPFFDTSTPHSRTFVNQSMGWAELEAQMTSERLIAVFESKVNNGEAISGNQPFGYSVVNKKVVPNEDADKAKAIFNYYNDTSNLAETLRFMAYELDIVRTTASLRSMLKNKKYIGKFRNNDQYCEPIINETVFNSVQANLSMNIKSNTKYEYIFSGILVCKECGHKLNSSHKHYYSSRRIDGTRIKYPKKARYTCRYANSIPKCKNTKEFKETVIEDYLLDNLSDEINKYIGKFSEKQEVNDNYDLKVKKIEKKLERLKLAYLNEIIDIDEYKKDRAILIAQSKDIKQPPKVEKKNFKSLVAVLDSDFNLFYKNLTISEKRRIWRSLIKEIRVDYDKNIEIVFL